jgi:hypothetical protein
MADDFNKDMEHYLHERKKGDGIMEKVFHRHPHSVNEVHEEIKHDLEEAEVKEDLEPEEKQDLEDMEEDIEDTHKEEVAVEKKQEGLLGRFFKKLNFKKSREEHEEELEETLVKEELSLSEEEMKEFLKGLHHWLTQLPSDVQRHFKASEDFKRYTKLLKKYDLIKGETNGR